MYFIAFIMFLLYSFEILLVNKLENFFSQNEEYLSARSEPNRYFEHSLKTFGETFATLLFSLPKNRSLVEI